MTEVGFGDVEKEVNLNCEKANKKYWKKTI